MLVCSLLLVAGVAPAARALQVNVDGQLITDNSLLDIDTTAGVIEFDSLSVGTGFATASGIDAKGRVLLTGPGGALIQVLNNATQLVLTDFVADRPASLVGGPIQFSIDFEHTFATPLVPGVAVAADVISAWSDDGSGNAPYFNGNGVPLAAGEDTLDFWQGYVNNVAIGLPFGPTPPIANLAGLNQPYPVYGHGPDTLLLCPGMLCPGTVKGELDFSLGGPRNQFILLTSAEVGFALVPEPGLSLLALTALVGLAGLRPSRRGL
jgi:hypothetical protein